MRKLLLPLAIGLLSMLGVRAQTPTLPPGVFIQNGGVPADRVIDSAFYYVNLSPAQVPSQVLLEHGYSSLDPAPYKGTLGNNDTLDAPRWRRLYAGMVRGTLPGATTWLPTLGKLDSRLAPYATGSVVPLPVLHYRYHSVDTTALRDNLFTLTNGIQLLDVAGRSRSPYLARTLFAVAPAPTAATEGLVTLQLRPELFFTNTGKTPASVTFTYLDDATEQTVTVAQSWDGSTTAGTTPYFRAGRHVVRVRIKYTDKSEVEGCTVLSILPGAAQARYNAFADLVVPVTGARSVSGTGLATGTLSIKYGCGNQGRLLKPLIIVEGYDPPQLAVVGGPDIAYDYAVFYRQLLNQNPDLEQALDNNGYDLVFLNFNNAGDYIQNNAYLLEAAIDWVNAEKARSGSTTPNVVLGLSMGGLVARYALRDMERNNHPHQTTKYISFDSPHQGAYIPIGLQYAIKHLASISISGVRLLDEFQELRTGLELLNLPSTRQLLQLQTTDITFRPGWLGPPTVTDNTQAFRDFQQEYQSLGNPQGDAGGLGCRSVAISNGSQIGIGQLTGRNGTLMGEHQELLRVSGTLANVFLMATYSALRNYGVLAAAGTMFIASLATVLGLRGSVEFIINGLPDQRRDRVYGGSLRITILWFINTTNYTQNVDYQYQPPRETAPGGYFDLDPNGSIGFNSIPFTRVQATRWCFIPTVSALDIRSPDNGNLFYNVLANNVVAANKTPFANVTGPDRTLSPPVADNDYHLSFTRYNNRLLRPELLPSDYTGNEALRFDGDDVVTIPNTNSFVNDLNRPDFTIEAFIRPERPFGTGGYSQTIFSNRLYDPATSRFQGVLFTLFDTDKLLLQLSGTNYYTSGSSVVQLPNDGLCHHVAVSRDLNYRVRFYIDGQEAAYSPTTTRSPYSTGDLSIGADNARGYGYDEGFQGLIGEVRVWNATRTTAQIQQTLATKLAAPQPGLVAYYDMQDAAQQVSDLSAVNLSSSFLSPGTLGQDNTVQNDDPTWVTRCNLPCTVQGNFRLAGGAPLLTAKGYGRGVALPDTLGQAGNRLVSTGTTQNALVALSVVPNPASNAAVVHFNPVATGLVRISLLDLAGTERVPAQVLTAQQATTGQYPLSFATLPPGTYLVVVDGVAGKKFTRLQVK